MARRFHTRSRARCSERNSLSIGSGKRKKRNPPASRRAASELLAAEFLAGAIRPNPAPPDHRRVSLSKDALYVFGCRGARPRSEHIGLKAGAREAVSGRAPSRASARLRKDSTRASAQK